MTGDVHKRGARRYDHHTIEIWTREYTKEEIGIIKMSRVMDYLKQDRGLTVYTIFDEMKHSPETYMCHSTINNWYYNEVKVRHGRAHSKLDISNCRRKYLRSDTLHRFQLAFNISIKDRCAGDKE